ncbi:unnamed protein product [Calypogeia fissa]
MLRVFNFIDAHGSRVQKDSSWIDTSDEDDYYPTKSDATELEESAHADEEDDTSFPNTTVEEEPMVEAVDKGLGASIQDQSVEDLLGASVVEESLEKGLGASVVEESLDKALGASVGEAVDNGLRASVVEESTNLDDLTPTQVLFGHGTYGGIQLTQPSPQQENPVKENSSDAALIPELCIPLGSPSPQKLQSHQHPDCTPRKLFSMSEIALEALPDVHTPARNLFQQIMRNVSLENPDPSADGGKSSHNMLVGLFSEFLHQLASPVANVPTSILESQEVSTEFNTTTPFVDLMVAQTQASTQSPKIQKLLAMVDNKIGNPGNEDA